MTLRPLSFALAAFVASTVLPDMARADSAYGCHGLADDRELATLEGADGVFYRVNADIRMNHPFSDEVVAQMAELSDALASRGTTLIYAPIPTKSVTMPSQLPPEARLYGFDLTVATAVHNDIYRRLSDAGVLAVDIRKALLGGGQGPMAVLRIGLPLECLRRRVGRPRDRGGHQGASVLPRSGQGHPPNRRDGRGDRVLGDASPAPGAMRSDLAGAGHHDLRHVPRRTGPRSRSR